jgi:hypothetical protein
VNHELPVFLDYSVELKDAVRLDLVPAALLEMLQRIAEEIYGFGIDPDPKGFGIGSLRLRHPHIHKRR